MRLVSPDRSFTIGRQLVNAALQLILCKAFVVQLRLFKDFFGGGGLPRGFAQVPGELVVFTFQLCWTRDMRTPLDDAIRRIVGEAFDGLSAGNCLAAIRIVGGK